MKRFAVAHSVLSMITLFWFTPSMAYYFPESSRVCEMNSIQALVVDNNHIQIRTLRGLQPGVLKVNRRNRIVESPLVTEGDSSTSQESTLFRLDLLLQALYVEGESWDAFAWRGPSDKDMAKRLISQLVPIQLQVIGSSTLGFSRSVYRSFCPEDIIPLLNEVQEHISCSCDENEFDLNDPYSVYVDMATNRFIALSGKGDKSDREQEEFQVISNSLHDIYSNSDNKDLVRQIRAVMTDGELRRQENTQQNLTGSSNVVD